MNRAERRARTKAITLKRQKFLMKMEDARATYPPGHWQSKHPYDCGQTKCEVCHWQKLNGRRQQDKRLLQREIDEHDQQ